MQQAATAVPLFSRLASATWSFSQRNWRLVLVLMLGLLHIAVFRGVADPWARGLLLAHLGLLLLWQPFLRAEQHVSPGQSLVLALFAVVVMLWLSWWLLALWVVVLAGLVGGKVYQDTARWQRRSYLVVLVYLLALLAVVILPEVAPRNEVAPETREAAEYALPLLLALIALFPEGADTPESTQVIDFFYSIFVMLLLAVVILGSFTLMGAAHLDYLRALTYTVFMVAAFVLIVGLAWNPRTGFAGLNVFFSRYLFSIGLPLERWLHFLAELSQLEARRDRFLAEAIGALLRIPSVSGAAWRAGEAGGTEGARSPHSVTFENSALSLTVFSRYRMSPALHWHLHLLGQLLGEFYLAKLREEKLREASYLQAVHETGARLTHDIKNLLQSLNVLCSVAAREDPQGSHGAQALLRRQLPAIAERLGQTLARLEHPGDAGDTIVAAQAWWRDLTRQYRGEGVEFEAEGVSSAARVPATLFSSVADNLLRNALAKRVSNAEVSVRVRLECGDALALRVVDSGPAVPAEIAARLFKAPIPGEGLGIGLYQAARQAAAAGYRLSLENNVDGKVCFALAARSGD